MDLPTLADRAWYAFHCLPRDIRGKLPSWRALELAYDLSISTLRKTFNGERSNHYSETMPRLAAALRCSQGWLFSGEGVAPTLPPKVTIPPRPGTGWKVYGDVTDWAEAIVEAKKRKLPIPHEAFRAGADMPISRHVTRMTPEIAIWISGFAWHTLTPAQQLKYSTIENRAASNGSHVTRARPLRRPASKC